VEEMGIRGSKATGGNSDMIQGKLRLPGSNICQKPFPKTKPKNDSNQALNLGEKSS
jgi:hypothetical protein